MYKRQGLNNTSKNTVYSIDVKNRAAKDYLDGKGSLSDICKKYRIRSHRQLRDWILKYNSHEELKSSGMGGIPIMTKGRKTTYLSLIHISFNKSLKQC